jgi:hypothetical protein
MAIVKIETINETSKCVCAWGSGFELANVIASNPDDDIREEDIDVGTTLVDGEWIFVEEEPIESTGQRNPAFID